MFFASELGSKPVRPFLHQNGDERDIYKELFGCQGLVMVGTVLLLLLMLLLLMLMLMLLLLVLLLLLFLNKHHLKKYPIKILNIKRLSCPVYWSVKNGFSHSSL